MRSVSLSPLTRHSRLRRPCFIPFSATTALPVGVRGPELFLAFWRFASTWRSLLIFRFRLSRFAPVGVSGTLREPVAQKIAQSERAHGHGSRLVQALRDRF